MKDVAAARIDKGWIEAYREAYTKANNKLAPQVNVWSRGWYYLSEHRSLAFKPNLYRRSQIEAMTKRLLEMAK